MNDILDIRTLSFVGTIVAVSVFISMLAIAVRKKTYPGFVDLTLAALFNAVGTVLMGLRDFIPTFLSVIIANNFIFLWYLFIGRGIIHFSGGKQKWWLDFVVLTILTIFFVVFTYLIPNVSVRIIVISALIFLQSIRICALIFKYLPPILQEKQFALIFVFAISGLWILFRLFFTILIENDLQNFMDASVVQGITFIMMIWVTIAGSILLINCHAQRLHLDLVVAHQKIKTLSGFLPICSHCKKIRDEAGNWEYLENYITNRSEALFSHGVCPECLNKHYSDVDSDEEI